MDIGRAIRIDVNGRAWEDDHGGAPLAMDPVQHFDGSFDFIDGFLFVYFVAPHFPGDFLMLLNRC
jgi:hypothetical protein